MPLTLNAICLLPRDLRDALLRRLARVNDADLAGIEVKLAETEAELFESTRLLHATYVARGLIDPKPSGIRSTPHQLLPSTTTFIARRGAETVGTLSLVVDSPLGLPMEKAFPEEVAAIRAPGRVAAEVGALCVANGLRRRGVSYLLSKIMFRCAGEVCGVDDLLISVVPPADELYRACRLFRRLGPERHHPSVRRGVVTVPMTLDLRTAPAQYRHAFGEQPTGDNPYYCYLRDEPQVRMPAADDLARARKARRLAAARLALACTTGLEALDVVQLRHLLKAAGAPSLAARIRAAEGGH